MADAVNPLAGYCGQGGEVVRVGEHLSLEATDLTGGRGVVVHGPTANDVTQHRVDAQPLGVVGILVTG